MHGSTNIKHEPIYKFALCLIPGVFVKYYCLLLRCTFNNELSYTFLIFTNILLCVFAAYFISDRLAVPFMSDIRSGWSCGYVSALREHMSLSEVKRR